MCSIVSLMKRRNLSFFTLLIIGSTFALACASPAEEDADDSAHDLSEGTMSADEKLATEALKVLGAPQAKPEREGTTCAGSGCHTINAATLTKWKDEYKAAITVLKSSQSSDEKIAALRKDSSDPKSPFVAERVGIIAAGAHLKLAPNVNESRHPKTYAQAQMFAEIFRGKDAEYDAFRKEALEPPRVEYPRLVARDYETVLTWFEKGLPKMKKVLDQK